jgi:hypothetical protein
MQLSDEALRLCAWGGCYVAAGALGAVLGTSFVGTADEVRKFAFGGGEMDGLYAWEAAGIGAVTFVAAAVFLTLVYKAAIRRKLV